jgi:3',5'-cyclic AMP phosphodiesterase CpdA
LKRLGLTAAALAAGGPSLASAAESVASGERTRVLRLAHVSDIHMTPDYKAAEGLASCLHHIQEHQKPDLIIFTGDAVFDSMATEEARVRVYWDLFARTWKSECSVPREACIGNHDIWGINKARTKTTGNEPMYGKKWAMNNYGWDKPFRSFDKAGWHFIALDTVMQLENTYTGRLDDAQFEWLSQDLARVAPGTPVLVFGHIPILSITSFFKGPAVKDGNWNVLGSRMMIDAERVKNLFYKHKNVKLCLQGHQHMVDRVDYLGTTYLCNGAVCGGWWQRDQHEFGPSYGALDLYADGTFDHKVVPYGWKYAKS